METLTDLAVELYHRYRAAQAEAHRLEQELASLLRNPDVNIIEYRKRMDSYVGLKDYFLTHSTAEIGRGTSQASNNHVHRDIHAQ